MTVGTTRTGRAVGRAAVTAAVLALAGAALLFVLKPLSIQLPAGGRDESWIAVLGEAAARSARWGVDITFTYGPASELVTRYFTEGYLLRAVPVLCGLALVHTFALALLARGAVKGLRHGAWLVPLALAADAAALATQLALDIDAFVYALVLALLLLDLARAPKDRAAAATVLSGAALLGAIAVAKTSFGVAALGVFILADVRAVLARRRVPALLPACLAGALACFLGHGQSLVDLPAYLDLQGQQASGYGEAMYLASDGVELGAFLLGAAALVAVSGLGGSPGRGGRVAAALGTAFLSLVGLKAGFVRADTHTQIAWSLLGQGGIIVAVGLVLPRSRLGAAALGTGALAVLWVAGPLFLLVATGRDASLAHLPDVYTGMRGQLAAELDAVGRFARSPSAFAARARSDKAAAWAAAAAARPMPPLSGTVDMLPSEQSAVLANGLDYRPRPSFQEYPTYTAGLIAANAAFYAGPNAPDWVIFGMGELDDRYPAATEGALWPELLRRYEPRTRVGPWVALRRRADPLADPLSPPVAVETVLGRPAALPFTGPVFARMTVRPTPLGRVAAVLFRPPALTLRVTLANGDRQDYRFVPAMAAGGFLLSPLLTDADGFADLALGHAEDTGGADVTAVAVEGAPWARFFYQPSVSVELRRVTVPAAAPSAASAPLVEDLARALPWRRLVRAIGRAGQLDGDRLTALPPTALTIPVAGARRLRLKFGISDAAWTDGATKGVCFAVAASPGAVPIWRRCLDPAAVVADRGQQSEDVDLPPGLAAVTAETSCREDCAWGWSYWGGIVPEN